MAEIVLEVSRREATGKETAKKLRRAGTLPAVVYGGHRDPVSITVDEKDLSDLSLGTWALSISDGLVWGIYSLIQHDVSIMIFGFFQLTTSGAIVFLKLAHLAREKAQKQTQS